MELKPADDENYINETEERHSLLGPSLCLLTEACIVNKSEAALSLFLSREGVLGMEGV